MFSGNFGFSEMFAELAASETCRKFPTAFPKRFLHLVSGDGVVCMAHVIVFPGLSRVKDCRKCPSWSTTSEKPFSFTGLSFGVLIIIFTLECTGNAGEEDRLGQIGVIGDTSDLSILFFFLQRWSFSILSTAERASASNSNPNDVLKKLPCSLVLDVLLTLVLLYSKLRML